MDPQLQQLLSYIPAIEHWLLSGLLFTFLTGILLILDGTIEEITVGSFEMFMALLLFGPLMALGPVVILIRYASEAVIEFNSKYKNKIIWRSKKSRSKAVLYGDKSDNDNDTWKVT